MNHAASSWMYCRRFVFKVHNRRHLFLALVVKPRSMTPPTEVYNLRFVMLARRFDWCCCASNSSCALTHFLRISKPQSPNCGLHESSHQLIVATMFCRSPGVEAGWLLVLYPCPPRTCKTAMPHGCFPMTSSAIAASSDSNAPWMLSDVPHLGHTAVT